MNPEPLKINSTEITKNQPKYFVLSNGTLTSYNNTYGGGFIKLGTEQITSFKNSKNDGVYFYIKDVETGDFWSSTLWPTNSNLYHDYIVTFDGRSLSYLNIQNGIETETEITVLPKENVEVRRLTLNNISLEKRTIEVTSYIDIVLLDDNRKDLDHQQFFNLFVESEYNKNNNSIIFKRRSFSVDKNFPVMQYRVVAENLKKVTYETNRGNFIGRLKNLQSPISIEKELTNFDGDVLDPAASFRTKISLKSGEKVELYYLSIVEDNIDKLQQTAEKLTDLESIKIALNEAKTGNESLNNLSQIIKYQKIISKMIIGNVESDNIKKGLNRTTGKIDSLWKHTISGDNPILLVIIDNELSDESINEFMSAHNYMCKIGFKIDLVFLNESNRENSESNLNGELMSKLTDIITSFKNQNSSCDGVFALDSTKMEEKDILYLKHVSKLIVYSNNGL